jgi:hypothetical protein
MDIEDLNTRDAAEEGAEVRIFNPLKKEMSDLFIKVKGIDSDEYRAKNAQLRQQIVASRMAKEEFDAEQAEMDILVAITVGWRGLTDKGESVEFSEKKCRQLYRAAPYIRDQLDRFIADRANFGRG